MRRSFHQILVASGDQHGPHRKVRRELLSESTRHHPQLLFLPIFPNLQQGSEPFLSELTPDPLWTPEAILWQSEEVGDLQTMRDRQSRDVAHMLATALLFSAFLSQPRSLGQQS